MKIATECICCGSKELDRWRAEVMPFVAYRIFVPHIMEYSLDFDRNRGCNSLRCRNCGVTFLDWRYSDEEIRRLYDGYRDEKYVYQRTIFEPEYRERQAGFSGGFPYVAEIEKFLNPYMTGTKILDYGGGNGINTPFREYPADVYDISGIDPEYGRLIDKPGKYDLVVYANVIEHAPNPGRELERIKKHMRGVLYIEVSLDDATDKKRWHEHINIFTAQSLLKLAKRCGLEVLDTKHLDIKQTDKTPYRPFLMVCR